MLISPLLLSGHSLSFGKLFNSQWQMQVFQNFNISFSWHQTSVSYIPWRNNPIFDFDKMSAKHLSLHNCSLSCSLSKNADTRKKASNSFNFELLQWQQGFPWDKHGLGMQHKWFMFHTPHGVTENIIKGQDLIKSLLLLHQRHSLVRLEFLFSCECITEGTRVTRSALVPGTWLVWRSSSCTHHCFCTIRTNANTGKKIALYHYLKKVAFSSCIFGKGLGDCPWTIVLELWCAVMEC